MKRIILFVCTGLLICSFGVMAQTLTNDNALVTITPSTRVTILGGALNNGDLVNQGTLSITGDWMNVDTYSPGSGLLILDGAERQNIAHNGGQVHQLIINGGGEKIITSSLSIQDILELNNGLITISEGVTLLVQSTGTVVGGSESSYVDGPLFHQGTGNKYYPVGQNGNFRPAELINVSGTNPVVGISVNEPNSDPTIPLQLLTVSDTRYWRLFHQSGVYGGSLIRVKVGSDERLGSQADLQDVVVSSSDSIAGLFSSLGQSLFTGNLLDGEVTSSLPATGEIYALAVEGFAEDRALYVPNALSPAAPNPEDQVIKVYGQQIVDEDFSFKIYDRWGQLVYETDSFTEANTVGWQGQPTSREVESIGVYQYTLEGRFVSGRPFERQGSITVIR